MPHKKGSISNSWLSLPLWSFIFISLDVVSSHSNLNPIFQGLMYIWLITDVNKENVISPHCSSCSLHMLTVMNKLFLSRHGRLTSAHTAKGQHLWIFCLSLQQSKAWWKCDAVGPCGLPCTQAGGGAWLLTSATACSHWLPMTSLIRTESCSHSHSHSHFLSLSFTLVYG